MIFGYSVYELLSLFFIYGFIGWCVEVVYCGLEKGQFVNRGFLNGPICPIYGVGAVMVILCLTPIKDNVFILFVGSALLTSLLELITGFALDKVFHARWWDYSDKPFNLCGYICLKFSVYWGFVCVALMKGIHPAIYGTLKHIPHILVFIALIFLSAVFIADIVITVMTINRLTKRVALMNEIAEKIHNISDEVGEHLYDGISGVVKKGEEIYNSENVREIREKYVNGVVGIKDKIETGKEDFMLKRNLDIEELKGKYANMIKETNILQKRIIKAFPNLKLRNNGEQLEKLKEKTF